MRLRLVRKRFTRLKEEEVQKCKVTDMPGAENQNLYFILNSKF